MLLLQTGGFVATGALLLDFDLDTGPSVFVASTELGGEGIGACAEHGGSFDDADVGFGKEISSVEFVGLDLMLSFDEVASTFDEG